MLSCCNQPPKVLTSPTIYFIKKPAGFLIIAMRADLDDPWGLSKSDCMWMVLKSTKEARVTHVSDAWLSEFCFDRSEVVGRSHKFLQGPGTDHPNFKKMLAAANKGMESGAPYVMYRKDGSCFVTFVQARTIAYEESEHLVLKFSRSETVTSRNVPSQDIPWMLLSADSRFSILQSSQALLELTGFQTTLLTSRSLRVLLGA
jgi:hypothetical protein